MIENRPYSNLELKSIRTNYLDRLRLSQHVIKHISCDHCYYVRKNGRKEKQIVNEQYSNNCSVCWKIKYEKKNNNDQHFINIMNMIKDYYFYNKEILTDEEIKYNDKYIPSNELYKRILTEKTFYEWLYDKQF